MTKLLIKLFIKNHNDTTSPAVRKKYGYLSAVTGILLNLLLFSGKLAAGIISGAVSVTADAFNNLSDAFSSVMTFAGFRLADRPADKEHPYGHGRMEYVTGLIISFIIIMMGFEVGQGALERLLSPESLEFSVLSVIVLSVSVAVKLWMAVFNRRLGKIINSGTLRAAATDSLSDCISTSAVIISMLVLLFTGVQLDAYAGLFVALFIIVAGIRTFRDSLSPLLGSEPDKDFINEIEMAAAEYPSVIGVHDVIVHDYGAGRRIISLHVQLPNDIGFPEAHEIVDRIENDLKEKYKCIVTIHADPAGTDAETLTAKAAAEEIAGALGLSVHDFRLVKSEKFSTAVFELAIPFSCECEDEELVMIVTEKLCECSENWRAEITPERTG
ncbi:MAG: cation transporter [Eubacterium sp.]|nr:cation transporter [Eubacterium sp.]